MIKKIISPACPYFFLLQGGCSGSKKVGTLTRMASLNETFKGDFIISTSLNVGAK